MDDRIIQFRVGVLVVATCIITAILVVLFGEWPNFVRDQYTITALFDEAPGVTIDTPVRKSGILIGRVTDVALRNDGRVEVSMRIDSKRPLRKNEVCRISPGNVLLGDAALEFVPGRDPDKSTEPLGDGATIDGVVAPSPLDVLDIISSVADVVQNLEDDITTAATSIQTAGNEVATVSRNLNSVMDNNQDQLQRIMQKSERAFDRFDVAMTAVDEFMSDDELRVKLRTTLEDVPELMADARETLDAIQAMSDRADRNLENLEGFTGPLGERGGDMVESIDQSIRRLDDLLVQLGEFGTSLNNREGSMGQFLHNPDLYQRINRAALNLEQISARLEPIVEDARIFTDKIARNPGAITSGVLRPRSSGIKW